LIKPINIYEKIEKTQNLKINGGEMILQNSIFCDFLGFSKKIISHFMINGRKN